MQESRHKPMRPQGVTTLTMSFKKKLPTSYEGIRIHRYAEMMGGYFFRDLTNMEYILMYLYIQFAPTASMVATAPDPLPPPPPPPNFFQSEVGFVPRFSQQFAREKDVVSPLHSTFFDSLSR